MSEINYTGNLLPENSSPIWTKIGAYGSPLASVDEGILESFHFWSGNGGWYIENPIISLQTDDYSYWEIRMKTFTYFPSAGQGYIYIQDLTKLVRIEIVQNISGNKIYIFGATTVVISDVIVSDWHIYKIIKEIGSNIIKFYVDDILKGEVEPELNESEYQTIFFGHNLVSGAYWDYLNYTDYNIYQYDITDSIAKQNEIIQTGLTNAKIGIDHNYQSLLNTANIEIIKDLAPALIECKNKMNDTKNIWKLYQPLIKYLQKNFNGFDNYRIWLGRKLSTKFYNFVKTKIGKSINSDNYEDREIGL